MEIEKATLADAAAIADLLNISYRGKQGWTNEAKLVTGKRCSSDDIAADIQSANTAFLVKRVNATIEACILVEKQDDSAYIGSFAVLPQRQNQGLGKTMLAAAERYAKHTLGAKQFNMTVLTNRDELIAYYERRGYSKTENISRFPRHLNVGTPLDKNQTMVELVKPA